MAVNQAKSKPSELAPTPEENVVEGGKVDDTLTRTISRTRSGVSLQERLLVCGNMTALLDAEARMGRRPSTTSLGPESTAKERGGDEDLGYFTLKRSPSQRSLLGLRRDSAVPHRRMYCMGIVGESSVEKSVLIDTFQKCTKAANRPPQRFVDLNADDILKSGRLAWPSNQLFPDAVMICKDISSAQPGARDIVPPLIDAFKSVSCLIFVLLLRSASSTLTSTTPQATTPGVADPLNDPIISRAFSQQTKVRFIRIGPSTEEVQRALNEILATLDHEIPQISPTRARGLSSPTPFSKFTSTTGTTVIPNLERRGSEASSKQTQSLSNHHPNNQTSPSIPHVLFQKTRPFHLALSRERQNSSSPPQSPKTLKPPLPMDTNPADPVTQDYLNSRLPFAIPSLPHPSAKPVDPPSPVGTTPSLPGSRRHSRLLDSESDFAASDFTEQEEWTENWPSDYHEEFSRALEGLHIISDGGGKTWGDLVDRLLNPGIPGEDEDFIFIFLVVYRKFAAPSRLLRSILTRFKEAESRAIDYMLQMVVQTRCCDVLTKWLLTHPNDFYHPATHAEARAFLASLDDAFILAHYSSELLPVIDAIDPKPENDPDRFWGRTDDNPDQGNDEDYESKTTSQSLPISPATTTPVRKRSLAQWDGLPKSTLSQTDKEAPERVQSSRETSPVLTRGYSAGVQASESPSPDFCRSVSQSTVATTLDGKEIYHRLELVRSTSDVSQVWSDGESNRRFEPFSFGRDRKESTASTLSGSAVRDSLKRMVTFWDATPEEIAGSLTRLEWDLFAALGPRDILRQMWTPEDKREKDSPMERIVQYFNHVAKWTAWTILYSPKLKERVRDLEKMLRVVIELRKLDNYDTLFAVISGLQNQSVHRLAKTFEEVKKVDLDLEDGRKKSQGTIRSGKSGTLWLKYQSCCALMARDRNFSPYRMAFKNSFSSRIPWISRHKADMLSAAAVNKTFISPDVIKWSGFEVIGDTLLSVLHCQRHPYQFIKRDENVERAILETPDISEQDLDAKSHEHEPPAKRSYSKSQSTGTQWISKTFTRR